MSPGFRHQILIMMAKLGDLVALCISFLTSLAISSDSLNWPDLAYVLSIRIKLGNIFIFAGYITFCSIIFSACGLYRSHRLSHWKQRLNEIFLAVTLVTGIFLLFKQLFLISFAVNRFLLLFWLLTLSTLFLCREIALQLLHFARLRGRNLRNVIIIGEGPAATALADRVRQEVSLGYRILRRIDVREVADNDGVRGVS
jgi:FlaA1/EpsC-like NDP-sugar epimerase